MRIIFLLTYLILSISFSGKAQEKQTLNLFYGYTHYFLTNNSNLLYNYNFGLQYSFTILENFKLDIGSSFNTRNYFSERYSYDHNYGQIKTTSKKYIKTIKLPQIYLSYKIFEINYLKNVYLFSGFDFFNIIDAYNLSYKETLNGDVFWEFKHDLKPHIFKQTGVNTVLGLSYYSSIYKWLKFRFEFCFLYNLRKDWYYGGSSSTNLHNPRFSFESKLGVGFVLK